MALSEAGEPSGAPARRGAVRTWAPRIGVAAGVLVVGAVGAVTVVLHSFDRPWLKHRVQAAVRSAGGVDIDYAHVGLDLFSGLEIDGLVVRSPAEVAPIAPEMLRVDRILARWRLGSLLGRAHAIDGVTISGIALAVVVDERGRTSFDAIPSTGPTPPPAPPTPLSRQAADALTGGAPVGSVEVTGVAVTVLRTKDGRVADRSDLEGLALALTTAPDGAGWRAKIGLGSPAAPLDLKLVRAQGDQRATARAKLSLTADVSASSLATVLDLKMVEQTFAPSVSADHWLHAEASAHFDPAKKLTEIALDHTEAGDGAVSASASVELPDTGDPLVRAARANVDLGRLLRWVPPGVVPVTAERATLKVEVSSLAAGAVPHLAPGGFATVDAALSNVKGDVGAGPLDVDAGTLTLRAQPADGGGIAARSQVHLSALRTSAGGMRVAAEDVGLDLDGKQTEGGSISGHAALRIARANVDGPTPVSARDARLEVALDKVVPGQPDPLTTRGDVTGSIGAGSVDAKAGGMREIVDGLAIRLHASLDGHAPYAADLDATGAHVRVTAPNGAVLADTPLRLKADVRDVTPNLADPSASSGVAKASVDLGEDGLTLDATKRGDSLEFALRANVPSLQAARPFLPPSLRASAPLDQIGVTLKSSGHVAHLGGAGSTIEQTTELAVTRPAFQNVAAQSVALTLKSKGSALRHEADADLRVQGLAIDGGVPANDHVTLSATVDREKPSVRVLLATEGRTSTKIAASASYDPARRALPYEIDAHLGGLAPIAPILAKIHGLDQFDVSKLDLTFASRGSVLGVVNGVGRDGTVEIAPLVTRTAGVEGTIDFRAQNLLWSHGDNGLVAPAIQWHGDLKLDGARRIVKSHLEADALHLDIGPKDVDLSTIRHDSTAIVSGDLASPDAEITQETTIGAVKQDFAPEYPVGDVAFSMAATRDHEGLVHLAEMKLANGAGGTTFSTTGNLEIGPGHSTLSVTTTLSQDLSRLALAPARFSGRGKVGLEATITSPDLSLFRVRALLKEEDVSLKVPAAGIEVDTANGQIPITVALEVGADGVSLKTDERRSRYSMLRFADQHPLLTRSGFLSIASLKTPLVTIAPLVGNLEIEQNFVSLRQFEMGVRNGSITGQLGLDWDGPKSTLELHVRASGVQSSHGEPFDGNIAVVISAGDRTVEGRAEILRIGERHLLDLLDMEDPMHVDPAMNRVRTALLVGYPDRLRLVFDHGFASAKLELGGLARLISISELRGIPMGPLVDKFLAPVLDPKDDQ